MNSLDAAWLAGFIDGDGCITLSKRRHYTPLLVIDSCDAELLEKVKRIIGAGYVCCKPKYKNHHRQAWSFRLNNFEVLCGVLREIYPFLSCNVKKQRAAIVLEEWGAIKSTTGVSLTNWQKQEMKRLADKFFAIGEGRGSRARVL